MFTTRPLPNDGAVAPFGNSCAPGVCRSTGLGCGGQPTHPGVQSGTPARTARALRGGDGFTLIEVMVTVAIVGILAAIALPSYSVYVKRSKIVEATNNLSDMRTRLEQYFYDNRQYPGACIASAPGPAAAGSIYLPGTMQYLGITCAFPTATTYTITATGLSAQGMGGFSYTINEANTHRTTGLPAGWAGLGSSCWVTKKGGDC